MAIRLGTEDKKKRWIAMISVSLALTLFAHTLWKLVSGPPSAEPPAATESTASTPAASNQVSGETGRSAQHIESATSLDPTLHPEWMAKAENTVYSGTSRNIFSKDSLPPVQETAAIEKPIASARTGPMAPSGPPPPPPIDLKFYGFAKQQNGRKLVFLMHDEDIFIAGVGDIVDGRYKVIQVNSNSVVVEDLAYTNQQTLPLLVS
ncbi:MAG TPA: hypothetical protein VMF56_06125 [Acidobacteriaceae bacterium]|nr:hypothetical protein [Acidobacteriaceae bacterium]